MDGSGLVTALQCVRASCTDANWDPWFIVILSYIEEEIGECCRVLTSTCFYVVFKFVLCCRDILLCGLCGFVRLFSEHFSK